MRRPRGSDWMYVVTVADVALAVCAALGGDWGCCFALLAGAVGGIVALSVNR